MQDCGFEVGDDEEQAVEGMLCLECRLALAVLARSEALSKDDGAANKHTMSGSMTKKWLVFGNRQGCEKGSEVKHEHRSNG